MPAGAPPPLLARAPRAPLAWALPPLPAEAPPPLPAEARLPLPEGGVRLHGSDDELCLSDLEEMLGHEDGRPSEEPQAWALLDEDLRVAQVTQETLALLDEALSAAQQQGPEKESARGKASAAAPARQAAPPTPAASSPMSVGSEEAFGPFPGMPEQVSGEIAALLAELAVMNSALDPADYWVFGAWDVAGLHHDVGLQRAELHVREVAAMSLRCERWLRAKATPATLVEGAPTPRAPCQRLQKAPAPPAVICLTDGPPQSSKAPTASQHGVIRVIRVRRRVFLAGA